MYKRQVLNLDVIDVEHILAFIKPAVLNGQNTGQVLNRALMAVRKGAANDLTAAVIEVEGGVKARCV